MRRHGRGLRDHDASEQSLCNPPSLVFAGKLASTAVETSSFNLLNKGLFFWKQIHPEDRRFDSTLCLSINKLAILSYSAKEILNYSQKVMHNFIDFVLSGLWIILRFYFWVIEAVNLIMRL